MGRTETASDRGDVPVGDRPTDGPTEASVDDAVLAEDERPRAILPLSQLLQISVYWLGINAIWGGIEIYQQETVPGLTPTGETGVYLAVMEILAAVIAIAVQPTIGTISDYTISRWGRRKPYIVIGATLDVVAIIGLITAQTYLWFLAFALLLQFSSNFAQGPFQGYVPDLVPEPQVGLASGLMGLMIILGLILGTLVVSSGYLIGDFALPLLALGLIEFATAMGTVLFVREGRVAKDRRGMSWARVGLSAWGTDILSERSYMWLLGSRLFFFAAGAFFGNMNVLYMTRSLGFDDAQKGFWVPTALVLIALTTAVSTIPAARISDRIGRKPIIYAAAILGALGMAIMAFAPGIEVGLIGLVLFGIASGSFITVDWALMTDIIPKASSGRYMGLGNMVTALQAPIAMTVGGLLMDWVGGPAETGAGPRAAFLAAVIFYLLAGALLRPVVEPRRRPGSPRSAAVPVLPGA